MDASYWPPFDPSPSSSTSSLSSYTSPVTKEDLPKLINHSVDTALTNFLVDRVQDAVDFGLDKSPESSAYANHRARNHSRSWRSDAANRERQAVYDFTAALLRRAEVSFSVVLGALIYIERAKPHLSIAIEEWAHHRVLMGALISAAKYLNDASLKNAHWALCSGVFGRRDVQRIEREFLDVLDFELSVKEHDLIATCCRLVEAGVIGSPRPQPVKIERERKYSGLDAVRRIWDEKRRAMSKQMSDGRSQVQVKAQGRPEKRQKSESMDIDVEEERGRFKERRTEAHSASAASIPLPRLAVSPTSSCSSCSSSSSPASSVSPQTPPQPSASAPPTMYNFPHYAVPSAASTPSKTGSYPILLSFPPVPTPPSHANLPAAPLPQPIPTRLPFYRVHSNGPKSALPLDFDMDADMELGREFAFESPTCLVPTYRPRSRTPSKLRQTQSSGATHTHKRSSALSLYPSYVAPTNA